MPPTVLTFSPYRFIEEVKKRPELYDPDQAVYRAQKLESWKQVGAALFPEWNSFSKATAYDRVLQLQKKWRSFRDAYNRELRQRRQDNGRNRKVYRYFKKMSFLGGFDGALSPPEETDDDSDEKKLFYTVNEVSIIKDEETETMPKKIKKKKRKRSSDTPPPPEEYEIPISMFSEVSENDGDSDKLFLMSYVSDLRQLPLNVKMWAKAQIANIMQEAVNSHLNNTEPGTSSNNSVKSKRNNLD